MDSDSAKFEVLISVDEELSRLGCDAVSTGEVL